MWILYYSHVLQLRTAGTHISDAILHVAKAELHIAQISVHISYSWPASYLELSQQPTASHAQQERVYTFPWFATNCSRPVLIKDIKV